MAKSDKTESTLSQKKLKSLPFTRFIPNLITLAALCIGLSAIQFSLNERWEIAVLSIFVAGLLDGMDGRVARILNSPSKFGAELDSLADFCNFGFAPAVVLYLYGLNQLGRIGWAVCLFYVMCMALRLARFNTLIDVPEKNQPLSSKFFMGTSAPVTAMLVLLPMIIDFQIAPNHLPDFISALLMVAIGCLAVSKIPTFSFKGGHIPRKYILPLFLFTLGTLAGLVMFTWSTLTFVGILYVSLIPISARQAKKEAAGK